jgi:hypothetical protein
VRMTIFVGWREYMERIDEQNFRVQSTCDGKS